MTKGLPKRIFAAGVAFLVPLLVLEVGLRVAGYDPLSEALRGRQRLLRLSANPDRVYELTPGRSGPGWGTEVRVNSHGFRDREYPLEKGAGTRVVVLGDSIVFGNKLAEEERLTEVAESALAEEPGVEVLNLGLGGYDTVQEVAFLEEVGLPFGPELVVVGFCVNDLGVVTVPVEYSWTSKDLEQPLYRLRTAQWVQSVLDRRRLQRDLGRLNQEESYAEVFRDQIAPLDDDEPLIALVRELRREFGGETRSRNVPVLRGVPASWFASPARLGRLEFAFDRLAQLSADHGFEVLLLQIPYLEDDPAFELGYGIVAHLARRHGFETLNLLEDFRTAGLESLRMEESDPVHPNATGHALAGAALARHVAEWRDERDTDG